MVLGFISGLVNSLILFINNLGYLGIFIGMAIESSIFPVPAEAILIPAGVLVLKHQMSFLLVFFAGILGSIVGSWISYFLAMVIGRRSFEFLLGKYGSFFLLKKTHLEIIENYFRQHGEITIFISRFVPVVRHLISLPAGFAKMNFLRFTLYTGLGSGIYAIFLILVGYFFGSNASPALKWITGIILLLCLVLVVLYFFNSKRKYNRQRYTVK